jgi:hypothetical protein
MKEGREKERNESVSKNRHRTPKSGKCYNGFLWVGKRLKL